MQGISPLSREPQADDDRALRGRKIAGVIVMK